MAIPGNDKRRIQDFSMLEAVEVQELRSTLLTVLDDLLLHDGFGRFEVDMKILKRGQKEVLISCGKEYRFLINFNNPRPVEG